MEWTYDLQRLTIPMCHSLISGVMITRSTFPWVFKRQGQKWPEPSPTLPESLYRCQSQPAQRASTRRGISQIGAWTLHEHVICQQRHSNIFSCCAQQIAIFNTFLCSKPSQREAHSRCTCPDRPLQSPFYLQKVHHQNLNGWIGDE